MNIIEEVADAIGGTPLRIAVWVGVGLTAGLGVGSRGKETNRGIPNPIDLAIQKYDFALAERLIRHTFPVSQQAEALAALERIKEEIGHHIAKVVQWNSQLEELVAAGDYDQAAAFVESIDIDSAERKRIHSQIRSAEKRRKSLGEWNRKLTAFVASGQFDKAITFVNKLDLLSSQRDATVARIRDLKREAERAAERRREVEEWNRKIARLTSEGKFDEAIAFAGRIDIGPDERDRITAQLRALKRQALGRTWALEIEWLIAQGQFRQAIAFAEEIDVEPDQRDKIIARIQTSEQQLRDELRRAESSRRPPATPVRTAAPKASGGSQGQDRARSKAVSQTLPAPPPGSARPAFASHGKRLAIGPGAKLEGANLRGASLQGKDLSKADLRRANLIKADLEGTDLRSAMLQGANLSQSNLRDAKLSGALFDKKTKWPAGFRALRYTTAVRRDGLVNVLTQWVV